MSPWRGGLRRATKLGGQHAPACVEQPIVDANELDAAEDLPAALHAADRSGNSARATSVRASALVTSGLRRRRYRRSAATSAPRLQASRARRVDVRGRSALIASKPGKHCEELCAGSSGSGGGSPSISPPAGVTSRAAATARAGLPRQAARERDGRPRSVTRSSRRLQPGEATPRALSQLPNTDTLHVLHVAFRPSTRKAETDAFAEPGRHTSPAQGQVNGSRRSSARLFRASRGNAAAWASPACRRPSCAESGRVRCSPDDQEIGRFAADLRSRRCEDLAVALGDRPSTSSGAKRLDRLRRA